MTAEEYIESVGNTIIGGRAIVKSVFIPKNIALEAVEMARKEEREKAIKAYRKTVCHLGIGTTCELCSHRCSIDKFKELLEKE